MAEILDFPVSDNAEITTTTVFPSLAAMWEDVSSAPWFKEYSYETRRTLKFAFFMAAAETLRTVSFRMNAEQNEQVFSDFDAELRAYDLELQQMAANDAAV